MVYLRSNYRKGFIGYTHSELKTKASAGDTVGVFKGHIYDLTTYVTNNG